MNTTRRQALFTMTLAAGALSANLPYTANAAAAAQPGADVLTSKYPFVLPPLPYNFDAMEPFIDMETMQIHHDKHHAAYVKNLNTALETAPEEVKAMTLGEMLTKLSTLPAALQAPVRNNGGGHSNHAFFWLSLKKDAPGPAGDFLQIFNDSFGGSTGFQEKWSTAAKSVFGSGWAWLVKTPAGKLEITTTPNQDSPISAGQIPLLGIDVWEHAYYLKYQNRRPEYIEAFSNVIDWATVANRFAQKA